MVKPRCYECLKEFEEGAPKCPHCGKPTAPGGPVPGPHGAGPQGVDVIFPGPHGATPEEKAPQPDGDKENTMSQQRAKRVIVPGPHGAPPQEPDIIVPGPHGAAPVRKKKMAAEEADGEAETEAATKERSD